MRRAVGPRLRRSPAPCRLDGGRAGDIDAVGLARGIGLDLVEPPPLWVSCRSRSACRSSCRGPARRRCATLPPIVPLPPRVAPPPTVASLDGPVDDQRAGDYLVGPLYVLAPRGSTSRTLLDEPAGAGDLRRQRGVGAAVARERAGTQRDSVPPVPEQKAPTVWLLPLRLKVPPLTARAPVDGKRNAGRQLQSASRDRRAAAITVGAAQRQRARAGLGEAARPADRRSRCWRSASRRTCRRRRPARRRAWG